MSIAELDLNYIHEGFQEPKVFAEPGPSEEELSDENLTRDLGSADEVAYYLRKAAGHPLLPAELERYIFQCRDAGMGLPTFLKDAEFKRLNAYVQGDLSVTTERSTTLNDVAILSNQKLVFSIAKRHRGRGMDLMDMTQEGQFGLIRAVDKFDWRRGYRFSTVGSWWIMQAIRRAILEHSRLIRLPTAVGENLGRYSKLLHELASELGREPTEAEVHSARANKGMTTSGFQNAIDVYQSRLTNPAYFSTTVGEDQEDELGDFLPSENPSPEAEILDEEKREAVTDALEGLKEKERTVIKLRFGLEDGRDYTLDEVGHKLNLTRERVRQIQREALYKLKQVKPLQEIIKP